MNNLIKLLYALWEKDFTTLADPSIIWILYLIFFIILFLENSLIPTSFLPGDSLLILVGVLCKKNIIIFPIIVILLSISAGIGSWMSYIQGKWLGKTRIIQSWISNLSINHQIRARYLFNRYGLSALLISRFIAFIRTLLPTLIGLSGVKEYKFHIFNWISSLVWVTILITLGYFLGGTSVFLRYEDKVMLFLIILPVVLMISGLIGSLIILWKKNTT